MEDIDKLYELFQNNEVELLIQLSIGLDLNLLELWKDIYCKFKDKYGDLTFEYNDRFTAIFYYPGSNVWETTCGFDRHKSLDIAIKELIDYLYGRD